MSVKFTKWNTDEVKKMAKQQLSSNADMAGKFVEDDARRRLNDIQKPDTKADVDYRNYLANYILTHSVEENKNEIVIRVGMKIGREGQRHHGYYIETGSSTAPAHTYLRPALMHNLKKILGILVG